MMSIIGITLICIAAYLIVGFFVSLAAFLITNRDNMYIMGYWPIYLVGLPISYVKKTTTKILSKMEEKRQQLVKANKPSYILAGTTATLLIRHFDRIETKKEYSKHMDRYVDRFSWMHKNILIIRDITSTRDYRRRELEDNWSIKFDGESYSFDAEEKNTIKKAFEKAVKLKEEHLKSLEERNRQDKALKHIEEFMGIEVTPPAPRDTLIK